MFIFSRIRRPDQAQLQVTCALPGFGSLGWGAVFPMRCFKTRGLGLPQSKAVPQSWSMSGAQAAPMARQGWWSLSFCWNLFTCSSSLITLEMWKTAPDWSTQCIWQNITFLTSLHVDTSGYREPAALSVASSSSWFLKKKLLPLSHASLQISPSHYYFWCYIKELF